LWSKKAFNVVKYRMNERSQRFISANQTLSSKCGLKLVSLAVLDPILFERTAEQGKKIQLPEVGEFGFGGRWINYQVAEGRSASRVLARDQQDALIEESIRACNKKRIERAL